MFIYYNDKTYIAYIYIYTYIININMLINMDKHWIKSINI